MRWQISTWERGTQQYVTRLMFKDYDTAKQIVDSIAIVKCDKGYCLEASALMDPIGQNNRKLGNIQKTEDDAKDYFLNVILNREGEARLPYSLRIPFTSDSV